MRCPYHLRPYVPVGNQRLLHSAAPHAAPALFPHAAACLFVCLRCAWPAGGRAVDSVCHNCARAVAPTRFQRHPWQLDISQMVVCAPGAKPQSIHQVRRAARALACPGCAQVGVRAGGGSLPTAPRPPPDFSTLICPGGTGGAAPRPCAHALLAGRTAASTSLTSAANWNRRYLRCGLCATTLKTTARHGASQGPTSGATPAIHCTRSRCRPSCPLARASSSRARCTTEAARTIRTRRVGPSTWITR